MHSQEFILEMKQKLEESKASLSAELSGLPAHTEDGDEADENAQEVATDDVNREVSLRISKDLEKIDIALAKIEDGTYGIDEGGQEISEERLRVLPWADTAI